MGIIISDFLCLNHEWFSQKNTKYVLTTLQLHGKNLSIVSADTMDYLK